MTVSHEAVTTHRAAKELSSRVLLDRREASQVRRLWQMRHDAAVWTVGSLPDPATEPEAGVLDEVEQLRDRVRAVLRVQERIGERRFVLKVRRLTQQRLQRMTAGQLAERGAKILNPGICRANADAPAELLQHVD